MGQREDSNRNAALDDEKTRSAGRRGRTGQQASTRESIKDAGTPGGVPAKGATGGAFGKEGKAERTVHSHSQGGGGGGGSQHNDKDAPADTPAKKR